MEVEYKNLFDNKVKATKSFNLRTQNLLNKLNINPKIIHNILLKIAPWTINQSIVKLELTKLSKAKAPLITFQENFHHIQAGWQL